MAFCALAVDLTGAWRLSQKQGDALQMTKDYVLGNGNTIKFASDGPKEAALISEEALMSTDFLPDPDCPRSAVVSTYESLSYDTQANRYIGVHIELKDTYRTTFARILGINKIPVRMSIAFVIDGYSTTRVWGVPSSSGGYKRSWEIGNESGKLDATISSERHIGADSDAPKALMDAIRDLAGSHEGDDWEWGIGNRSLG